MSERNHQVFLMNKVYAAAEHVLVWLGEDKNRNCLPIDGLKKLAAGQEITIKEIEPLRRFIFNALINQEWWADYGWFRRAISFEAFMAGCVAVRMNFFLDMKCWETRKHRGQFIQLGELRKRYTEGPVSFTALLTYTKDFDVTAPCDNIYGCLGLLQGAVREVLKPEYQKSTELLYREATKYLLQDDHGSFFSRFLFTKTGRTSGPSWVPDFSAQKSLSSSDSQAFTTQQNRPIRRAKRCVSFQDLDSTLSISGLLFDSIETAVELKDSPDLLIGQIPELEHLMKRAFRRTVPSSAPWFTKLRKYEDIFSILVGGGDDRDPEYGTWRDQYEVLTKRAELLSGKPDASS